ncbi:MAG: BMC domain-containing protein [Clostridia bacterium]|nr:BMC domain-containing protein [Clostridia bacterium]MEE0410119.1 BMC domain-containing protein [Clostridia bacterium]
MDIKDLIPDNEGKLRIIQELVPGKQVTLAHVIASPDPIMYQKLGLNPDIDFSGSAIGILTVSPAETAIIAADIATKSGNIDLSFVDRFSGTLIITGLISDVESALKAICDYVSERLGFSVCELSRT